MKISQYLTTVAIMLMFGQTVSTTYANTHQACYQSDWQDVIIEGVTCEEEACIANLISEDDYISLKEITEDMTITAECNLAEQCQKLANETDVLAKVKLSIAYSEASQIDTCSVEDIQKTIPDF